MQEHLSVALGVSANAGPTREGGLLKHGELYLVLSCLIQS